MAGDIAGDIVEPILVEACRRLSDRLGAAIDSDGIDRAAVRASVLCGLNADLRSLVELPAISMFHRFREDRALPAVHGSTAAMNVFRREVDSWCMLVEMFPILRDRIRTTVSDRIEQVVEVVTAFRRDRQALIDARLIGDGDLVGVECTHGDPHVGGRRVALVRVGSHTVVWKPRDFGPDVVLAEVLALVDPDAVTGLVAPRFVAGRGYGWQQFFEHRELPPDEGADPEHRFHVRMGRLLALFAALGSTDMHVENIVAYGEFPMPIDVETLVHPATEPDSDALASALGDGPFGTSMLPSGADAVSGTSIAALSDAGERTMDGVSSYVIVRAGTDAVAVERTGVRVSMSTHRPHRRGVPVGLADYVDDVLYGYRDTTCAVRAVAPQIRSLLESHRSTEFRRVIRPTAVYTAFLDAAKHPRYLVGVDAREELFAMLPPSIAGGEEALASELAALRRGDVPRFVASAESPRFRPACAEAGTVTSAASDSALRRALRCLDRAARTPWFALEHAVRSSLSTVVGEAGPAPVYVDLQAALAAENIVDSLARVSRRIAARSVYDDAGVSLGLVQSLPAAPGRPGAVLVSSDRSIYHGGGSLLLMVELASRSGRERWRERVTHDAAPLLRAVRASRAAVERGDRLDPCLYTGSLGTAWMLACASKVTEDAEAEAEARSSAHQMLASVLHDETKPFDVVGGVSGACALMAQDLLLEVSVLERMSVILASELSRCLSEADDAVRGLAHGLDGIAWALSRVDSALVRTDHGAMLERVLELGTRPRTDPRNVGASWCWGTTGILLAHAEIAMTSGDRDRARALARRVADASIDDDDSICHGDAGVVLASAHLGSILGDTDLSESARVRAARMARRISERGYRTGHGGSVSTLSFMTGVPGIAYARAVASNPGLPNPVALT